MHLLTKTEAIEFVHDRMALFKQAEKKNPFAGGEWTLNFLHHIAEQNWTIVVPEDSVDGQTLMLLYNDANRPRRWQALTNYYASLYSPCISSDAPDSQRSAVTERLVEQIICHRPGCAVLDLVPIEDASEDCLGINAALSAAGWYTKVYQSFGNWHLLCDGVSFEDYMESRESRLKHTWLRKHKKFLKSNANDSRLEIITEVSDVNRGMDAYEQVYGKSWKKPEPYRDFIRDWAKICARNGWLRLGLAWFDHKPIAAQFWFTMHGRAYIFKLAYDEDYAKLSVGTILSAHLFQKSLDEDNVKEIDYLTGDDSYKKSWMSNRRQRIGLLACNPRTPSGLLQYSKELLGDLTRPLRTRI